MRADEAPPCECRLPHYRDALPSADTDRPLSSADASCPLTPVARAYVRAVPQPYPSVTLPHANAYAVVPGQLLAGEYPGAPTPTAARAKVRRHLEAGVRLFVDLTEEGELAPYAHLVAEESEALGVDARHVRFAIPDAGVPADRALMEQVVAAMHTPGAYVHCWGGIGRTGTAVGCYLRDEGLGPDAALAEVQRLYGGMEKAHRRPQSPETEAQRAYVRQWAEPL